MEVMSGTETGWIKLHRRFLRSPIWQNPNVARFWTWCLLKATHDGYTMSVAYKKITLTPGQFLYNHPSASIETGLSQKVVRSCLDFLKSGDDPEIGQAQGRLPGNRYSIITILKWADYQNDNSAEGRRRAGKRAGAGQAQGSLINKVGKNVKKEGVQSEPVDVTWTGEKLNVPDVLMEKYKTKFPHLDLIAIITDSERWLLKHPQKASTYKSFDAFLNNWMRGEEEKRKKRDGNDYELTGESLATAEQCARIHGRAVNE